MIIGTNAWIDILFATLTSKFVVEMTVKISWIFVFTITKNWKKCLPQADALSKFVVVCRDYARTTNINNQSIKLEVWTILKQIYTMNETPPVADLNQPTQHFVTWNLIIHQIFIKYNPNSLSFRRRGRYFNSRRSKESWRPNDNAVSSILTVIFFDTDIAK